MCSTPHYGVGPPECPPCLACHYAFEGEIDSPRKNGHSSTQFLPGYIRIHAAGTL